MQFGQSSDDLGGGQQDCGPEKEDRGADGKLQVPVPPGPAGEFISHVSCNRLQLLCVCAAIRTGDGSHYLPLLQYGCRWQPVSSALSTSKIDSGEKSYINIILSQKKVCPDSGADDEIWTARLNLSRGSGCDPGRHHRPAPAGGGRGPTERSPRPGEAGRNRGVRDNLCTTACSMTRSFPRILIC